MPRLFLKIYLILLQASEWAEEVFRLLVRSDDEMVHVALYQWLIYNRFTDRLLSIQVFLFTISSEYVFTGRYPVQASAVFLNELINSLSRSCPFSLSLSLGTTVCPRSSYTFYVVTYYIEWVTIYLLDRRYLALSVHMVVF